MRLEPEIFKINQNIGIKPKNLIYFIYSSKTELRCEPGARNTKRIGFSQASYGYWTVSFHTYKHKLAGANVQVWRQKCVCMGRHTYYFTALRTLRVNKNNRTDDWFWFDLIACKIYKLTLKLATFCMMSTLFINYNF